MAEKRGHDDKESTPPRKKVRLHSQKYMSEYEQSFPCFRKSAMGVNHAYCTVCNVNISISHGGIGDLKKHIGTKKHVEVAKLREGQKISNFFPSKSTSSDDGVIRAEVIFTKFIIENNAPLTLADNAGTMFRNMFPDSEIAKKYSCARTKSTAIAHCLAEDDDHQITKVISTAPFSIATDGSNDYGDVKLYPIIVKYFDDTVGLISTTMLTLSECEGRSTGENIFRLMDHELKERAIPWSNCLSFAADNASVMTGVHKGVLAFVKKENENIYFIGCPCHLIHLAAEKGANVLPLSIEDQLIQVYYYLDKSSKRQKVLQNLQKLNDVEVRKILKHVSTRWLSLGICLNRMLSQWVPLTEFFKEESKTTTGSKSVSQKPSKPVKDKPSKPVKDKPSKSVKDKPSKPNSVKDKPSKPDSVKDKPSKPVEKLVSPTASKSSAKKVSSKKVDNQTASSSKGGLDFLFSKETDSNQSKKQPDKGETTSRNPHKSDSKKQTDSMDNTSQKSEPNFAAKKAKSIYENFKSRNFKLYCLFLKAVIPVFDNANQLLQNEKPCIHILHSVLQGLLQSILTRFVKPTVLIGSPESVNFKDRDNQKEDSNLFIGVEARAFIQDNPNLDTDAFFKAVRAYFCAVCTYMCKNFPFGDEVLVNARVADITQRKDIEFNAVNFFVQRFPVLAGIVGESLNDLEEEFLQFQVHELSQDILDSDRMDLAWYKIGKLIHPMTGNARFPLLTKVMLGILTIFHSNTDCERIFSFVTKTKTKFRPNMKTGTLGALVTHKVCMNSRGESAFKSNPSTSLLKKAKKATYEALSK